MSALPPALFGGLITLYIFQQPLSIYSFVGMILLIGIVLKNGIMLIDFANEALRQGNKSPRDAITQAALIRFRPILMTTCSAIMGALPIALGSNTGSSQAYIPLGLCIVGGLCISQLITLLLTPVLYFYFEELSETITKAWEKRFLRN
jgi:HAE1 family hydrophobic/amphiphilic exporter-1